MRIKESLSYVSNYFQTCDWDKTIFCWKKAFISAVFSNVAYCHISELELKNTKNVNLIPSEEYEKSINGFLKENIKPTDIRVLLEQAELETTSLIIESQFAVASVVRINNIVFVSLRGTEISNIYDWRINFNALKTPPHHSSFPKVKLHRGVYKSVLSFKEQLEKTIMDQFLEDVRIYVTGHSLGGALAAVLYGLWSREYMPTWQSFHHILNAKNKRGFNVLSAYTFGMPRFANLAATAFYPNPYHVLNSKDIVPNLPPKYLGYENCTNNFPLDKSLVLDIKYFGYWRYLKKLGSIITLRKLEHHSIETYVKYVLHKCENS